MSIKEKIKKIPMVLPMWHGILHCKANCSRNKSENYMKKVIKISREDSSKKNRKIKVGFIVQMAESCWDKQVSIVDEMLRNDSFDVKLLVVPEDKWTDTSKFQNYENNYFLEKYPRYSIKALNDDGSCIDVSSMYFDYVFFPRPYDVHLPKKLRSTELVKFTKCCYVPYGYSCSDNFNGCNVENPFFDNIYMEFTESEYIKSLLCKKYSKSCDKKIQHFEFLGYPCLEEYLALQPRNEIKTITWTPRWSYDPVLGGSNFIEYKDNFIELCKSLSKDIHVIFRPHPLMFDELVSKKILSEKEKDDYIKKLNDLNVHIDLKNPIDVVLRETDILISDFSSILVQYFITNRPIIYCKKNIEFNNDVKELEKYMYLADSWNKVETNIKNLISGKDSLAAQRKEFINKKFSINKGSAKRIVERIISDYEDN